MDMITSLNDIFNDLKEYVCKNINELNKNDVNDNNNYNLHPTIPTLKWSMLTTCAILNGHPRGISKDVLLTELESRWKTSLKRCEYGGKLSQCVAQKELNLSDIIEGKLTKTNEFICNFISEDTSVDIILHRQHTDFLAFSKFFYKSLDQIHFLTNRKCRVTGCRMLLDKKSIILPTPFLILYLTSMLVSDKNFINDILYANHKELLSVLHNLSLSSYEDVNIHENNCPKPKAVQIDPNLLSTLNDKAIGCFVQICMISKVYDHPHTNLSVFRYVRLNMISDNSQRPCYIYLILLDDQINLANLFNLKDIYYIYRPYIALNIEESLFKSREEKPGHHRVLQYSIVYRDAITLNILEDGFYPCPCYFLYGATTTLIKIDDNELIPFLSSTKNTNSLKLSNFEISQSRDSLPEVLYLNLLLMDSILDNEIKKQHHIFWGITNVGKGNMIFEIQLDDESKKKDVKAGQLFAIALSDLYRITVKSSQVIPLKLSQFVQNNNNNENYTIISGMLQGPLINLSRILAFSQSPSIMLPHGFKKIIGTTFVLASPIKLSYDFREMKDELAVIVEMKDHMGNNAECLFNATSTNLSSKCFISDKIQFSDTNVKFAMLVTYVEPFFVVECISENNDLALEIHERKRRRE